MWQTLDRKAAFLAQLYAADRSIRKIEDLSADDLAESTALVKAMLPATPLSAQGRTRTDIEDPSLRRPVTRPNCALAARRSAP